MTDVSIFIFHLLAGNKTEKNRFEFRKKDKVCFRVDYVSCLLFIVYMDPH